MWRNFISAAMAGVVLFGGAALAQTEAASKVLAAGESRVDVAPDIFRVEGTIFVRKASRDAALTEANALVQRLRSETPRIAGVAQAKVTASDARIGEEWPPGCRDPDRGDDAASVPPGDCRPVAASVRIRLRMEGQGVDRAGAVMSFWSEAGVGDVALGEYAVSDLTAARAEAKAVAVRNALAEAETLAKAAGGRLGRVLSVQSTQTGPEPQIVLTGARVGGPIRPRVAFDLPPPDKVRVMATARVEVELLR